LSFVLGYVYFSSRIKESKANGLGVAVIGGFSISVPVNPSYLCELLGSRRFRLGRFPGCRSGAS